MDKRMGAAHKGERVIIIDTRYGFPSKGRYSFKKAVEMAAAAQEAC